MSKTIELSYVWDRTITKILNYNLKSEMGIKIKEWIVFNKLDDFNSLLNYIDEDFTPTGNLYYINDNGEKLPTTTLQEFYNPRWFIQHLIDKNGYEYGDHDYFNPLSESNWIYLTNENFMKYVIFTLQKMTPEQLKMNPFKPIIKVNTPTNQQLDTEERESNNDEEKSTTSQNCQNKNLHLIYQLKILKNQNLQKHFKFIMCPTKQYIMKVIHLKKNL